MHRLSGPTNSVRINDSSNEISSGFAKIRVNDSVRMAIRAVLVHLTGETMQLLQLNKVVGIRVLLVVECSSRDG